MAFCLSWPSCDSNHATCNADVAFTATVSDATAFEALMKETVIHRIRLHCTAMKLTPTTMTPLSARVIPELSCHTGSFIRLGSMLLLWTVYLYILVYSCMYTCTEAWSTSDVRESHLQIYLQLLDVDVRVQVRLPIAGHVQAATSCSVSDHAWPHTILKID